MNKRMETASRTPRLALALLVLALILAASGVSASDSSLALSDFNRGGLEVEVAALFEAGAQAAIRRSIRRRDRGGPSRVLWSTGRCCLARAQAS